MKRRLVIALVADDVAKLNRFPAILNSVEGRIENRGVRVQLRIGCRDRFSGILLIRHRPCRPVNMLRPYDIAGEPVAIRAILPDARLDIRLDFRHGFPDGFAEGGKDSAVAAALMSAHLIGERHRLRRIECEVASSRACRHVPWC